MIFVDRLPLVAIQSENVEKFSQSSYNKLMPRTLESLHVVSVTLRALTIDENGIQNKVKIDRATTAPNQRQGNSSTQLRTAEASLSMDLRKTDCSRRQSCKEYAVDRIVRHKGDGANIH